MSNYLLTKRLQLLGGRPSFQVYGKARPERDWRVIDVFATHRRNFDSRCPLWRGVCITSTDLVIVVGAYFSLEVLREQAAEPASLERPVEVIGGRIGDRARRLA